MYLNCCYIYLQYTIFSGPTGMYVKYTTQYILAVYIFLGPDRNAR